MMVLCQEVPTSHSFPELVDAATSAVELQVAVVLPVVGLQPAAASRLGMP